MKTIRIRLEDSVYEELDAIIPFIIKAPLSTANKNYNSKMEAFARLEESRKNAAEKADFDKEREEAMNEKYGIID